MQRCPSWKQPEAAIHRGQMTISPVHQDVRLWEFRMEATMIRERKRIEEGTRSFEQLHQGHLCWLLEGKKVFPTWKDSSNMLYILALRKYRECRSPGTGFRRSITCKNPGVGP